jgi:hypothetical protein
MTRQPSPMSVTLADWRVVAMAILLPPLTAVFLYFGPTTVACRSLAVAGTAASLRRCPALDELKQGVGFVKRMTPQALVRDSVHGGRRIASEVVRPVTDGLHVRRIETPTVAAQMVNGEPVRYRAPDQHVRAAMDQQPFVMNATDDRAGGRIAGAWVHEAGPIPTAIHTGKRLDPHGKRHGLDSHSRNLTQALSALENV